MSTRQESPDEPRTGILGRMRSIERAVHREMQEQLAHGGYPRVRIPHIALLAHMTTSGRRLTEFAELMQVTKSAVSQLASDLERQGLVERVPDPTDGRAALIRATSAADQGFRIARKRLAEIEREWERQIGPDRLAELEATLEELEHWQERLLATWRHMRIRDGARRPTSGGRAAAKKP
jgi:DNA-binding MarR family transcriptional regulator